MQILQKIQSFLNNNMYEKQYSLDEVSVTLLRSNKWKEFHENIKTNTRAVIYTAETSSKEISLIGKKKEVEKTYEEQKKGYLKVKVSVEVPESCLASVSFMRSVPGGMAERFRKYVDRYVSLVLERLKKLLPSGQLLFRRSEVEFMKYRRNLRWSNERCSWSV